MALNLPIRINQSLHGYSDGHRLISSSVELPPRDARNVLRLSDGAAPGMRGEQDTYLTGYPMLELRAYALAMTWAAPEMPRPGCVWTHTLYVDYADLASLKDLTALLNVFKRPTPQFSDYGNQILSLPTDTAGLVSDDHDELQAVLRVLYSKPTSRVVADRTKYSNSWALRIWSQQWPKLRRGFRFCTNSGADRSLEGQSFDLQFAALGGSGLKGKFPKCSFVDKDPAAHQVGWLNHVVRDIWKPDVDGLRTFLHQVGAEADNGRKAFSNLSRLHMLLRDAENPKSTLAAIDMLGTSLASIGNRAVRSAVAIRAAEAIGDVGATGRDFVLQNLDVLEDLSTDAQSRFGSALLSTEPRTFFEIVDAGRVGQTMAEASIRSATEDTLFTLMEAFPDREDYLVSYRADLLCSLSYWQRPTASSTQVRQAKALGQGRALNVVKAIIGAGRPDLAAATVSAFGARLVLPSVILESTLRQNDRNTWLWEASRDLGTVAEFLTTAEDISFSAIGELARLVPPDGIPNHIGDDPWLTGLRRLPHLGEARKDLWFMAYLFYRALGASSRNPAELSVIAFEVLHAATARSQMSDESWSMLSSRLPRSFFDWDWDRCWRLRAALCDMCLQGKMTTTMFLQTTSDEELFFSLCHWLARSKSGRDYLWPVLQILEQRDPGASRARTLRKMLK